MLHRALSAAAITSLALVATAAMSCPDQTASSAPALAPAHSAAIVTSWKPRAWHPQPAPTTSQGMVVEIDPVTGEFTAPSPEFMRHATPAGLPAQDNVVPVEYRADGSAFARLDERHMEYAVVQIGTDGTRTFNCVHGQAAAERAVAAHATRRVHRRKGGR